MRRRWLQQANLLKNNTSVSMLWVYKLWVYRLISELR